MRCAECAFQVPLHLVLSHRMPGCCPDLRIAPPLNPLLTNTNYPWEIAIGTMLLWAVHHPETLTGGFWSKYSTLLMPRSRQQTSLLFYSKQELQELQVNSMQHSWSERCEQVEQVQPKSEEERFSERFSKLFVSAAYAT